MKVLLGTSFINGQLWLFFEPVQKHNFEQMVVTVLRTSNINEAISKILMDVAESHGYFLICRFIIDHIYAPFEAFGYHQINSKKLEKPYFLDWLIEKFTDMLEDKKANYKDIVKFSDKITENFKDLVILFFNFRYQKTERNQRL